MLVEDFYHIAELESRNMAITAEVHLNPEHRLYKGHFPQQAVVPGVMQIQIIREVLESGFKKTFLINEVVVAKYLRPVTPKENKVLNIQITYIATGVSEYLINAMVNCNETTFTKVKARLSESAQ